MGLPFSVEWKTQVYGVGGLDSQRLNLGNRESASAVRLPASNYPDCVPQVTGLVSPLLLGWCSLESPTGLGILRQQKETCTLHSLGSLFRSVPIPGVGRSVHPQNPGPWLSFHPTLGSGHHSGLPVATEGTSCLL